ncbi:MAG: MgtC/SapB family protein [Zoogloea sp.]|nr:MgtC/SapB family protein [Zoogloea sp.]
MSLFESQNLAAYWSAPEVATNLIIFMNLLGALALGMLVGYERAYHGRAAGMRTYGLVCMASAAITVVAGYPGYWFGGHAQVSGYADPTRVIQGVVTGVGFLGAGVIMKEGLNISGLTTAASIWAASAIGVMVGVGFYAAAILLALLSAAVMMWMARLENFLPSRPAISVSLRFMPGEEPNLDGLKALTASCGYDVALGTFSVDCREQRLEWQFVAVATGRNDGMPLTSFSVFLGRFNGVESFHLSHARN